MLRLDVKHHENVARGSYAISISYDLYDEYFERSGWIDYRHVMAEMEDWCRERWGLPTGETARLEDALWMICGKQVYVRTDEQAIELRLRWHGAKPKQG
jgi:hypothetical protein